MPIGRGVFMREAIARQSKQSISQILSCVLWKVPRGTFEPKNRFAVQHQSIPIIRTLDNSLLSSFLSVLSCRPERRHPVAVGDGFNGYGASATARRWHSTASRSLVERRFLTPLPAASPLYAKGRKCELAHFVIPIHTDNPYSLKCPEVYGRYSFHKNNVRKIIVGWYNITIRFSPLKFRGDADRQRGL